MEIPSLVASIALLALAAIVLLVLRLRRKNRRMQLKTPLGPTIPFLTSPDGDYSFKLNHLEGNGMIIGRARHGIALAIDNKTPGAETVADQHARIYQDGRCDCVMIEDLDSPSGIFVNGRRAPRKNLLRDGWTIELGELSLIFRDGESDTGPLN